MSPSLSLDLLIRQFLDAGAFEGQGRDLAFSPEEVVMHSDTIVALLASNVLEQVDDGRYTFAITGLQKVYRVPGGVLLPLVARPLCFANGWRRSAPHRFTVPNLVLLGLNLALILSKWRVAGARAWGGLCGVRRGRQLPASSHGRMAANAKPSVFTLLPPSLSGHCRSPADKVGVLLIGGTL
jgi:hypothetical protein